jgi:hypothetical protein
MMKKGDVVKVVGPDKTERGSFVIESVDPDSRRITAMTPLPDGTAPGDSLVLE